MFVRQNNRGRPRRSVRFTLSSAFLLPSLCVPLPVTDAGSEAGQLNPGGGGGSPPGLLIWVVSACVILLLLLVAIPSAVLCKCRRCVPDRQQSASVSLNTLAVPKRDSISSDNVGSDRSEIVFPPQASDSRLCRHFERLSGEYGAPVYIVKEITPQSPTNIYYKV